MLGRRLDRVVTDDALGRPSVRRSENSATFVVAAPYRQFVCLSLDRKEENKIQFGHCCSQQQFLVVLVVHRQYEICDSRMAKFTRDIVNTIASLHWTSEAPWVVTTDW